MLQDREDAARQLVMRLQGHGFQDPLILAIPRGGIAIGAVLARELRAELDVLLCRRIRAPWHPETSIGAVYENGSYFLNCDPADVPGLSEQYVEQEVCRQSAELHAVKALYRRSRLAVSTAGRSVIVTDDGIATGATMIAALQGLRAQQPFEIIVAVPVAAAELIDHVQCWCDEVVCCHIVPQVQLVDHSYREFPAIDDAQAIQLLIQANAEQTPNERARSHGPVHMPINHIHGES